MSLDAADRERVARGESIDLARDIDGVGRVRAHVFRTVDGLAVAVRLLPSAAPSLASLLMPVPLGDLVDLPNGLVLVCGATGSGKSTTLAALAQEALRKRSIVLTTLEDPIEYALTATHSSIVRRRQIGRDVRDFTTGLRDALREDPDILLVGELRDPQTIALALTAAETGQLVLASMHSRSAGSAIERIVDAMPEGRQAHVRGQLAESLRAVIAQQLLPRLRGSGRLPAVEVLRVTHAVASLIREGKTSQVATALQSGRREGMIVLERCLADRVLAGEVSVEEARAVANDPTSLAMYLAK
jgi:twitching motility protein PilT